MKELVLKAYIKGKVALTSNKGSVLTEYGLIIALVVVGSIAVLKTIGANILTSLTELSNGFTK
ncbi:Flp family type IVb pilin [Fusibacter sp. JL216-2]|uniref:Flp family type IVb pilin n=1 Tax=Fusibacter sp. JL216-2 TaxID=3071453 RepID=UPI003D329449